jgi:hypothetical protein
VPGGSPRSLRQWTKFGPRKQPSWREGKCSVGADLLDAGLTSGFASSLKHRVRTSARSAHAPAGEISQRVVVGFQRGLRGFLADQGTCAQRERGQGTTNAKRCVSFSKRADRFGDQLVAVFGGESLPKEQGNPRRIGPKVDCASAMPYYKRYSIRQS